MNDFRPLRDVFDDVAAGAAADLPDGLDSALLAQALASYCETTGIEVAEHLEGFTTAVRNHELPDLASGLELLASAPTTTELPGVDHDVVRELDGEVDTTTDADLPGPRSDDLDIDFGTGTDGGDEPDAPGDSGTDALHDRDDLPELSDPVGEAGVDESGPEATDALSTAGDWWGAAAVAAPDSPDHDDLDDVPTADG